jgi:hypothetical protein
LRPEIEILIKYGTRSQQLIGVRILRKQLSSAKRPPIQQAINLNLVPVLIELLTYDKNSELQFESAWCLTNIASGSSDQTKTVASMGAINAFIGLLNDENCDSSLLEQSIWALGNIAGDGAEMRDKMLEANVLDILIRFIINFFILSLI